MSQGNPWTLNTSLTRISDVSVAEGSLERGTKWANLLNLSTMVRITVLPTEEGNPVTKSRARCDQGRRGIGRG